MTKKIVVTGSSGLVGSQICKTLSSYFDVLGVSRNISGMNSVSSESLDLTEESFLDFLKLVEPGVIVHCAAKIPSINTEDDQNLYDYNNKIDSNILTFALRSQTKVIYMSSTSVYGSVNNELDVDEQYCDSISDSFYSRQKSLAERKIAENLTNYVILRLNAPYGTLRHDNVMKVFIKSALQDKSIYLYGTGRRMQDFTHVVDIADLVKNIIDNDSWKNATFNISSGHPISMRDLASTIVKLSNSMSEIVMSKSPDVQENFMASFSTLKARQNLKWRPKISLETGINEILKDFRE